ncbi:MAG: hypothetical protein IKU77_01255 [Alistipes sp.]|nr:hypothetical protein [Alistipes sp.]
MNLDITLSITKKQEAQHNTFLLRWNPAISSYTMDHLDDDMSEWADSRWWDDDFDWSVYEWQKARKGDRFFMVRVGEGNTGIFAAGRFTSEPYKSEDWSGKGREVYYMKMEFEAVFHPERSEIISTEDLERELPHLDWRKGHSGQLLEKEDAVRLELMWRDFVGRNKTMFLPRALKNEDYDSRSDIDKAIEFASKAHAADYDLDGNPTILHPLAVGMMGQNDTERIVGFLHDVVEDTKYDFDDLIDIGFSSEVIAALRLLTHDKRTPYMEYVAQICKSNNRTAIHVKMNDLRHNLARGKAGGHMRCVEKHTIALQYMEDYLLQHSLTD